MRWAIAALLWVLACAGGRPTPIEGAWRSNRDLTLAELRSARAFSNEQWRMLSDPSLFGHLVHVYRGNRALTVFEGECSPVWSFEVLESRPTSVSIHFFDEFFEEERTSTLTVEGDRLYIPIALLRGGLRETFTRVSPDEVTRRHPCAASFLEDARG